MAHLFRLAVGYNSAMLKRVALAAVPIGLVIAGCSSQVPGHPASSANHSAAASTASSTLTAQGDTAQSSCGVYMSGGNVRVLLTPSNTDECNGLAKQLSTGGAFWTVRAQSVDDGQLTLVCAMTQNRYTAYVEDTGGEIYGRQLCSSFLTSGWNEDTGAENQVASAVAAASASSASAAQLAKDEDSANQLVASLHGVPSKLNDYLATMDGHVQQALTDLAKTKSDAANGQGDSCYNVSAVAYDASSDVGYDATDDVGYDATSDIGYVINQARQDLASLQALTQRINGEGGTAPSASASTSSSVAGAIASAISRANSDIDQANAAATAAFKIAADLSTGACTGYAPGSFQPVPHIS